MNPLLNPLLAIGSQLIDRLWPNPQEKAQAKMELIKLQQSGELAEMNAQVSIALAQAATNTEEAKHSSFFIAGWRPAIGWCMVSILTYTYLIYPMSLFTIALFDIPIVPPSLSLDDNLWQLILGMLGLSVARSVEKIKGVAR